MLRGELFMPSTELTTPEAHGRLGTRERAFMRLLPPNPQPFDETKLRALAEAMIIDDDELNDGADAEENLFVPAGYTYFGQFVDHDLTFDTTSSFDDPGAPASNLRTPALDLDCVYGSGPDDQPYMYAADGATLLPDDPAAKDLLRIATNGRAVIGDKRNDENSIVCQIQLAFIKFHNAVVRKLAAQGLAGSALFKRARQEVSWTYQHIVLEDYLRRIVNAHTYDFFSQRRAELGDKAYDLYPHVKRTAIPIEFAGAAYRFGHSMVRTGYRLNSRFKSFIFDGKPLNDTSLVGFQPLPANHVIDDWRRFFADDTLPPGFRPDKNTPPPEDDNPAVRLQWAYKIDPSLVMPLANLPPPVAKGSLAALNLLRGNLPAFRIATGQAFAQALGEPPLDATYLVTRRKNGDGFTYAAIDPAFLTATPLWAYILAEAQRPTVDYWIDVKKRADMVDDDFVSGPASGSQLGPVGGRILMEVFNGLVDEDPRSFRNSPDAAGWQPMVGPRLTLWHLLSFAGLV
jgi:Animal haem peroxidase